MLSFVSVASYNFRSFQGHSNTIHDDILFHALTSRVTCKVVTSFAWPSAHRLSTLMKGKDTLTPTTFPSC